MSGPPEDDLPPEIEEIRRADQALPMPSPEVEADILSRLRQTLNFPLSSDAQGGGDDDTDVGAAQDVQRLSSLRALRTVATLLVGAAAGAGVHASFDRYSRNRVDPPPIVEAKPITLTRPSSLESVPPPSPRPSTAPPVEAPTEPPRARRRPESDGQRRDRDRELGAERSLLEQARTALARGEARAALAVLDRCARAFPRGTLVEERQSLLVQALVGAGRYDQARKEGAHFHQGFPNSIFGAAVDDVLRSIP